MKALTLILVSGCLGLAAAGAFAQDSMAKKDGIAKDARLKKDGMAGSEPMMKN